MKKGILFALGFLLLLPAVPVQAASRVLALQRSPSGGGHRGGGHRGGGQSHWGRGRGWGWGGRVGWGVGWGWGYPGYGYGYGYGYPPYRYEYGPARWAVVDTDVSPEEARVYLDGKYIGLADDFDGYPDYLYLRRGRYRLEFRLDGFQSKLVEVTARPGQKLEFGEKLVPSPGARRFGSYETPPLPEGVRRFWGKRGDVAEADPEDGPSIDRRAYDDPDDDRRDRGREDRREVEPNDDREELREDRGDRGRDVAPPEDAEDDDEVAPDRRDRASEDWRGSSPKRDRNRDSPTPRPGGRERSRLKLQIEPSDAAVYLDDRFIGTAEEVGSLSSGLAVSPGKHKVTVSRPGYRDQTVDVEVGAGETESVELSLER